MATKRKLQVRYGAAASRPTLSTGELGLDTDTGSEALYIGTPAGNKQVGGALGVKRYVALLTQTGTNAPVATVLENTLGGTVVWSYQSPGSYRATLSNAFALNKTLPTKQAVKTAADESSWVGILANNSADYFDVYTGDDQGNGANGVLVGFSILITVYP